MPFPSSSLRALAVATFVTLATLLPASSAHAQARPLPDYGNPGQFEITPFGGWQWGGSFTTDAQQTIPAGKLRLKDGINWGVILSRLEWSGTAVELLYLRQDADVSFEPKGEATRDVGKMSNNYIQVGGRRALRASGAGPFISASLGTNIIDADASGATWRFAWTLGGGLRMPLGNPRVALRVDARWMATLVPSGDYSSWCTVWGCYAAQGSTLLNQGQASAGLSIGF